MANTQSLIDRLYYNSHRNYTHREGNISYLDSSPLRRPLSMPRTQKIIATVIVAVAAIIGLIFLNNTALQSLRENAQAEETIAANLQRQASIDTIPTMAELMDLGNDDIRMRFQEAGYNMYDASDPNDPENMVLYRIPDDMTIEEAAALYAKGVGGFSAVQASKLLTGSWYFDADRRGATSMVVRYADFSTSDPVKAMQNAMKKQGFDLDSVIESGEDDSGNTFTMGSLSANGVACIWRVSALPLSDVYSISGLPEDACYVGIRLTVQ